MKRRMALLFACVVLGAAPVRRGGLAAAENDEPPDAPLPDITLPQLAEPVRKAQERYATGYLEAEFGLERDESHGHAKGEPDLVRWPGRMRFAGDGRRWRAERDSHQTATGIDRPGEQPDRILIPRQESAGFDGQLHYTTDGRDVWVLGQENWELANQAPDKLFWAEYGGLDMNRLLADRRAYLKAQETHEGLRCYVVEQSSSDGQWSAKILISPRRSYLAVRVERRHNDRVFWVHDLGELEQTASGEWFPRRIVTDVRSVKDDGTSKLYEHREVRVTRYEPMPSFAADQLSLELPYGVSVLDRTNGTAYFNDPWWPDVREVAAKAGWPPIDGMPFANIASSDHPPGDGRPAQRLEVAEWIAGDEKDADFNGHVTLLYFFGSHLMPPVPEQLAALRKLDEMYGAKGLKIIAVAASGTTSDQAGQIVDELKLPFSVVIDARDEQGRGKTMQAYHVGGTPTAVMVDLRGTVHRIEDGQFGERLARLLKDAGAENIKPLDVKQWPMMPVQTAQAIENAWLAAVNATPRTAQISGQCTDGSAPLPMVEVEARLQLVLLSTTSPFGFNNVLFRQRDFKTTTRPDGKYVLPELPKGTYEVTFSPVGKAKLRKRVIIGAEQTPATLDVVLDQADGISGRVVDEQGKPLAGAKVMPSRWHFDRENLQSFMSGSLGVDPQVTDGEGSFYFSQLFQGAYTFEIVAAGFENAMLEQVSPGTAGTEVRLMRATAKKR